MNPAPGVPSLTCYAKESTELRPMWSQCFFLIALQLSNLHLQEAVSWSLHDLGRRRGNYLSIKIVLFRFRDSVTDDLEFASRDVQNTRITPLQHRNSVCIGRGARVRAIPPKITRCSNGLGQGSAVSCLEYATLSASSVRFPCRGPLRLIQIAAQCSFAATLQLKTHATTYV